MRFNHYEEFPYRGTYINMAAWCNQPNALKKSHIGSLLNISSSNIKKNVLKQNI